MYTLFVYKCVRFPGNSSPDLPFSCGCNYVKTPLQRSVAGFLQFVIPAGFEPTTDSLLRIWGGGLYAAPTARRGTGYRTAPDEGGSRCRGSDAHEDPLPGVSRRRTRSGDRCQRQKQECSIRIGPASTDNSVPFALCGRLT